MICTIVKMKQNNILKNVSFILIFMLVFDLAGTAQKSLYQNLIFEGDHLVYQGKNIALGPKAFFIDGQLSNEEAAKYSYVYSSLNEAAKHLTNGTEDFTNGTVHCAQRLLDR